MKNQKQCPQHAGLQLVITFFALWAANGVIFLTADALFPKLVVMGTHHISKFWTIIHAASTLTMIDAFCIPFVRLLEEKQAKKFTSKQWLLVFLAINFIGLWSIGHLAEQLGLGLVNWGVVLVLAIIIDLVQNSVMAKLGKAGPEKSA